LLLHYLFKDHQAVKASTTLIRPMKFGDDKSKAPASFLFLAGAWLNLEPFRLDSTSAANESHTFSRKRRRNGRDDAYRAYRYYVFQITLRHLYVYEFASDRNLNPRF
jgi:hypothetical protein